MSEFNVWSYLAKMGVSVKGPNSRTLAEGDKMTGIMTPTFLTLEDIEEYLHKDYGEFSCQAPGCKQSFSQLHESELHYNAVHRHCCSVCRKTYPSPHLLELHIQESHDSFFAVLSERKPSYQCFLPTCSHVTWTREERHEHAIQEHKFPPDFRFDDIKKKIVKHDSNKASSAKVKQRKKKMIVDNIDTQTDKSKLRRPLSLARLGEHFKDDEESMEVDVASDKTPLQSNGTPVTPRTKEPSSASASSSSSTGKKSKIPVRSNSCKLPKNLSFGAGVPRGFPSRMKRSKDWHQMSCDMESVDTVTSIETSDLTQLRDSLPV